MSRARRLLGAVLAWNSVLFTLALAMVVASELGFAVLGGFDAELLSLILVPVLPFFAVRFFVRFWLGTNVRLSAWRGCPALVLVALLTLWTLSAEWDGLMLSRAGGRWSAELARSCRIASAPLEVLARP